LENIFRPSDTEHCDPDGLGALTTLCSGHRFTLGGPRAVGPAQRPTPRRAYTTPRRAANEDTMDIWDSQTADAIISACRVRGHRTLDEHTSKQFLACFGIPVCREVIAAGPEQAARAATGLGFPVVAKACGPSLAHKTEASAVALDLRSAEEVWEVGSRLRTIAGAESLLVQELVPGNRELLCGSTRKPGFGPCVVFGIGGVLTEAIDDVSLRLAPLTADDAAEMVNQIRLGALLGPFRGALAVDRAALGRILVTLGEIACRFPGIAQIDINPLKVRPDGSLVAVDALVVLQEEGAEPAPVAEPPRLAADLRPFFEPASVAIIGASITRGKPGHELIRNILANGYEGRLYLVNPQAKEILGLPVYPSVHDLPETPDLAVIIVPASACPQALADCVARGTRHAVVSAGGFAEFDSGGADIQRELERIIAESEVRVLGPNTAGHTSTPHRFTSGFFPLGHIRPGTVSYITQTGNFCTHTMKRILTTESFGVARVMGLGNAIDIDECDALEYMATDPATTAVVMYLESIQRPRRFLKLAQEVRGLKPLVLLKSGSSEAGSQAAIAHTAALAAEDRVVDALVRQAGIVRLTEYTQLVTAGKALSMAPLPRGNNVGFLAPSGAMLVTLTDLCGRLGLTVPPPEPRTIRRLEEISPPLIRMRNPVDIWAAASVRGVEFAYREGMKALLEDPNIDAVVPILLLTGDTGVPSYQFVVDLAQAFPNKPVMVSFSGEKRYVDECREFLEPRGVATFLEIEEPFEALSILARCAQVAGSHRQHSGGRGCFC
jgi:acyl-CoA synthetase (NDP forming)